MYTETIMACYQAEHLDDHFKLMPEYENLPLDHEIMYTTTKTEIQDILMFRAHEITSWLAMYGIKQVKERPVKEISEE